MNIILGVLLIQMTKQLLHLAILNHTLVSQAKFGSDAGIHFFSNKNNSLKIAQAVKQRNVLVSDIRRPLNDIEKPRANNAHGAHR